MYAPCGGFDVSEDEECEKLWLLRGRNEDATKRGRLGDCVGKDGIAFDIGTVAIVVRIGTFLEAEDRTDESCCCMVVGVASIAML